MKSNKTIWFYLYFGCIGILSFLLMMWITPYGSGVSPDSTTYIGAAKSLLSGDGFSVNHKPITHYPPLYPSFLAVAGFFENDLGQASRFLNALAFSITACLVAWAVYLATERNFLAGSFAVVFFLSSATLLMVYSYAWSEPLFITFSLACVILLSIYAIRPSMPLLVITSLSLGSAIVTRYIGLAFLPPALAIVFMSGTDQPIARRLRNMLLWAAIACFPLVTLFTRNLRIGGSTTNRSLVFHPVPLFQLGRDFISTVTYFLVPASSNPVKLLISGFFVILLVTWLVVVFKHRSESILWRRLDLVLSASCFLFSLSYTLFLFLSLTLLDAATPVNARILSPIFVILIVGFFSATWVVSQILKKTFVWWSFLLCMALSIWMRTPTAIQTASDIQKNGLGYTARQWQESESIAFVRSLAKGATIYSNGGDVLDFLTERRSLPVPRTAYSDTKLANPQYDEQLKAMCRDITENGALLVYLDQITWRWYFPSQDELQSTCHLPVLHHFSDGTVYGGK